METYNKSQETYVNGKVISAQTINAEYDGKNLAIDMFDNGEHFYSQLNNNDIADILSHRASSLPLEKRLLKDFSIKKGNKNKSNKKKSNKKKSNKNKSKTYKKKSIKK
jgi:hypothetical protein